MRRILMLAALGGVVALASCDWVGISGCAGVGYFALRFDIRDAQGQAQALGATVTLTDGDYQETNSSAGWDSLSVFGAGERGGRTYDVVVSKPHYNDVVMRRVKTRGGGCVTGHEVRSVQMNIPVTLTLASSAPPIRSVHLLPPRILLDRASPPFVATPLIDANAGVSRGLTWRLTGDTASVSFDTTTGRLTYRCKSTSGYLKLIGTSVVDSTISGIVDVSVQGHPAAPGDPPCS